MREVLQQPFDARTDGLVVGLTPMSSLQQVKIVTKRVDVPVLVIVLFPVEQAVPFVEEKLLQFPSFPSEFPCIR